MKVILVPVSNRPESKTALKVSADLANRMDGNVVACHLRPHREINKDYKPVGIPLFGSANREWLDELNAKSTKSVTHEARKIFEAVAADADLKLVNSPGKATGHTALWQEKVGSPDKLMGILGPVADLTVLSRPTSKGGVARMFVLAALLHTGRPVMLLPPRQTKAPGKRIAIAWNQGAEVSRVVSACMPLLQSAEQVTIIACGPEGRPGPKASHLKGYLRSWGVTAKVIVTPGKEEETELLNAYADSKSDLLLMGGYSRSRFREIVFGGMTEFMLWKAKIPLIIQHSS